MTPDPPESPLYLPGGKLLIKDGKMVTNPTDCCCAEQCAHCEGITPWRFRVTFSGVSLCTGCYVMADGKFIKWVVNPSPAISASYILGQDPADPCHYFYDGDMDAGETGIWTAGVGGCIGAANWSTDFIDNIRLDLTIAAGNVALTAYHRNAINQNTAAIFVGNQNTATPCGGTTVINADEAACGGGIDGTGAWATGHAGGTATVVKV